MKVLLMSLTVCAFAVLSISPVRAADDKKPCCEATVDAGKKCDHKCCQKASEKGNVCKKCHKTEDKK
jgi:hypothetical protein